MTQTAEDILEHHGVKGMKWGVRKAEKAQSQADRARRLADSRPTRGNVRRADRRQQIADKRFAKADKKWEKSIYTMDGAVKVHNETATRVNSKLDGLNSNPKYKDTRPLDQPRSSQLYKDYINDYERLTAESYNQAVTAVHGSSPSGKKKAVFVEGNDFTPDRIEVVDADVQHAASDEPDLVINVSRSPQGLFNFANFAELAPPIEHYDVADAFLAHYGVKGMKWGVHKERNPVEVSVKTAPGRKVKAAGGKNHSPSEDAIKAAKTRQQAKKSTTDSLSNKELKELIERMNLEAQYKNLNENNVGLGKKLLRTVLGQAGDKEVNQLADFASDRRGLTTKDKKGNRVNDPATSFAVKAGVAGAKSLAGGGKKK